MTIDDVIDWVVCLLGNLFIFDKIENDIINEPQSQKVKIPKNCSVKSVHVSKWIICSYAEVTDRCGFDLLLTKFGSVCQF